MCGVFDKGIVALWGACKNFFYPRVFNAMLNSPKHFTPLVECDTKVQSSVQLSTFLVCRGRRYFLGCKQPPLAPLDLALSNGATAGLAQA